MKHTKGPWTLNKDEVYGNNGRDFIADIFNESESYKANANLIASAPEMFEELEKCLNYFRYKEDEIGLNYFNAIELVLKKARGE